MAELEQEEIRSIISRHTNRYPVHVVPLANELGLPVYSVDSWSDDVSGAIIKTEPSEQYSAGFAIYVNAKQHVHRRRFTIAHEIGHFVQHRNQIGDGITDDALFRSGASNLVEYEANQFAADTLMPNHLLLPLWAEEQSTIGSLAAEFWVSEAAMSIRLGVPSWESV